VRELGATELAAGDAFAAKGRYREALQIAEKTGDAAMIADLCRRLGALAQEEPERYNWYDYAAGFLSMLGLDPQALQAVQMEKTQVLPGLVVSQ